LRRTHPEALARCVPPTRPCGPPTRPGGESR
jgi:hypothetical protein